MSEPSIMTIHPKGWMKKHILLKTTSVNPKVVNPVLAELVQCLQRGWMNRQTAAGQKKSPFINWVHTTV